MTSLRNIILKEGFLGYTVALSVKEECDVCLVGLYYDGKELYEPSHIDMLLGFFSFWHKVRGVPEAELDLSINGSLYKSIGWFGSNDMIGIKLDKCKQLYSYSVAFEDGVEIFVKEFFKPFSVKLIECSSPESFDMAVLRQLRLSGKGDGFASAFSYKGSGVVTFVSSSHFLFDTDAAFAICSLLLYTKRIKAGERLKLCSGSRYMLCSLCDGDAVDVFARCEYVTRKDF